MLATAASFILAVRQTSANAPTAYFSTLARAWELGIGAVLAVTLHRFPALAFRLDVSRGPLLALGLCGIAASALFVRSDVGFPAPAAALPVLATALVIFAGAGGPVGNWSAVLTNPISRYLGRISFSVYLWHWPVLIVADSLIPSRTASYYAMALSATAGLSVLSYHFVELPFHRRPATAQRAAAAGRRDRRVPARPSDSGDRAKPAVAAVLAAALLTVACSAYALKPPPAVFDTASAAVIPESYSAALQTDVSKPTPELSAAITTVIQATAWPKLEPTLDQLGVAAAWKEWTGCRDVELTTADCTFADTAAATGPSRTAVVLGDSMSLAWLPGIRAALEPQGWRIYGLALEGCPAAEVSTDFTTGVSASAAKCDAHHAWVLQQVTRLKPGLVILSSSENTLSRLHDGSTGLAAQSAYQRGMTTIAKLLVAPGRRIVTLAPPPQTVALAQCDIASGAPADCVKPISDTWFAQSSADAAAAKTSRTTYVDTRLWFCTVQDYCPSFVGTTPMYYDGEHLTHSYAVSLRPELVKALAP